MTTTTRPLTVDELWDLPDHGGYVELVRGELRPMPPSGQEHSSIGTTLIVYLGQSVRQHDLGRLTGPDGGYLLAADPDTLRVPDIGFVSKDRLPDGRPSKKFFQGAPELAVEIVSPSDSYDELEEKVHEFLQAGTRLVWVISPGTQTVTVYAPDRPLRRLTTRDTLFGEEVVPQFSIPVADVFV